MKRPRDRMACPACGRDVVVRRSGEPSAHSCPHGRECQRPAFARGMAHECPECAAVFPRRVVNQERCQ